MRTSLDSTEQLKLVIPPVSALLCITVGFALWQQFDSSRFLALPVLGALIAFYWLMSYEKGAAGLFVVGYFGLIALGFWLLFYGDKSYVLAAWFLPGISIVSLVGILVFRTTLYPLIFGPLLEKHRKAQEEKEAVLAQQRELREIERERLRQERVREELRLGQVAWQEKLSEVDGQLLLLEAPGLTRCPASRFIEMLSWEQLEETVASLLIIDGWDAQVTKSGADGGVDVRGVRINGGQRQTLIVQVKHWSNPVGAPNIRELIGVKAMEDCSHAIFVTSSSFVKGIGATFFRQVDLWDGDELSRRIDNFTDEQFEAFVTPFKHELGLGVIAEQQRLESDKRYVEENLQLQEVKQRQFLVLENMKQTQQPSPKCQRCGGESKLRRVKTYFWGCETYPTCHWTMSVPEEYQLTY